MSRFFDCPDAVTCVGGREACPGPGLIELWAGRTPLVEEPFCPQTNPGEAGREHLLAAVAKRGVCAEVAHDAAQQGLGAVVLTATAATGEQSTLVIYQPAGQAA
ncbi:MAG TPA: hypothetical protein VF466_02960 [Candidatus Saccharimonadales bacterium]